MRGMLAELRLLVEEENAKCDQRKFNRRWTQVNAMARFTKINLRLSASIGG